MHWGIDLGGTKTEGVVLDDDHSILCRKRISTEASGGMEHIIDRIVQVIDLLAREVGKRPTRIGVGTPGSIDPDTGLLEGSNTQAINRQPFLRLVQDALGIPVVMENDANCFALAETLLGAAADVPRARIVFGVILGTGTGGGIVIDQKPHQGRNRIAGEWGHTFLDASGGLCYCGKVGCVERILSGPALEMFYEKLSGKPRSLKDIYTSYEEGDDEAATKTIERLIHFFGLGLSQVVNILDPDVIVLGGGVSNLDVLYDEGIQSVQKHVFRPTFHTPILRPKLGDSAGVLGAALLAPSSE